MEGPDGPPGRAPPALSGGLRLEPFSVRVHVPAGEAVDATFDVPGVKAVLVLPTAPLFAVLTSLSSFAVISPTADDAEFIAHFMAVL